MSGGDGHGPSRATRAPTSINANIGGKPKLVHDAGEIGKRGGNDVPCCSTPTRINSPANIRSPSTLWLGCQSHLSAVGGAAVFRLHDDNPESPQLLLRRRRVRVLGLVVARIAVVMERREKVCLPDGMSALKGVRRAIDSAVGHLLQVRLPGRRRVRLGLRVRLAAARAPFGFFRLRMQRNATRLGWRSPGWRRRRAAMTTLAPFGGCRLSD